MNAVVASLAPPLAAFAVALGVRLFARDKAERCASVPLAIVLLAGWAFLTDLGWTPVDEVTRIAHIVSGAALIALLFDALRPGRFVTAVIAAVFVAGSALGTVTGRIIPARLSWLDAGLAAALALTALLVLARLQVMRAYALGCTLTLTLLAAGLFAIARMGGEAVLADVALVLALALAGYTAYVAVTGAALGDGLVLLAGSSVLAIVWAVAQRQPDDRLALALLPLVLFAEPSARRVPLPAARISAFLYPLILAGFVSLPLALAAVVAYVTPA